MSSLDFPAVHSDCPLPSPAPCPIVLREGNWEGMGQTEFPGPIASSLRAVGASCANATFYTLISTQYAVPKTRTLGKTMTGKDTPVSKVLALPCRNLSLISTTRAEKATCGGTHLHSQRWDGKGKQNSGAHWPAEPASLAYLKNSRPERDPALEKKKKCAAPVIHLKLSSAPTPRATPNMNTHTHAQARTLSPRRTWLPTLNCSPSQIITKWIRITPTFATMATAVGCATADF